MNHFSSALTAMRRSPYQTLVAFLMVTLTCFVGYVFSMFLYSAETILKYFETRPQVIAFFDLNAAPDQITDLERTMLQKPYVEGVTVVSKEQALEIYQQDNRDDPLLLELVTADILPASIEVSGRGADDLIQIRDDLTQAPGVDDVVYQQDVIESLSTWTNSVRLLGVGGVALLGFTSFLMVMTIIGVKMTAKRQAIHIMRIIGATGWYIKGPFMIEGMLYGLVGSLLGWSLMMAGLLYVTPWLRNFLGSVPLLPFPPALFAVQVGVGTAAAMIIGAFAAITAAGRFIKR